MATMQERALMTPKEHLEVLIIEDDRTYRLLASESLHNFDDYIIHKSLAENARKGVEMYNDLRPDITLLDIMLPDGNGLDLLDSFVKTDPDSFVVMMTGSADAKDVRRAQNSGAKGYVLKPFNIQKMREVINGYHAYRKLNPKRNNYARPAKVPQQAMEEVIQDVEVPVHQRSIQEIIADWSVLFVDGNLTVCQKVSEQLATMNCHVDTAVSANEAMMIAGEKHYQAIIMEANLSGTSGYQLSNQLRHSKTLGDVDPYIIGMVKGQDEASTQKRKQAGMSDFLIKPCDFHDLQQMLWKYARQYKLDVQESYCD